MYLLLVLCKEITTYITDYIVLLTSKSIKLRRHQGLAKVAQAFSRV